MYLLEDTPDAAAMRQNVCDMLYSHDESNALLACQLIEGGGFHGDFLGLVAAYVIEEYWQGVEEKPFHALLKKNISPSKMTALRKLYGMHYAWDNLVGYLEAMTWIKRKKTGASWAKHWKEWALIAFRWEQYCSIICLKHALVSADELFQSLVYHYGGQHSLYLNGYDLEDLPEIFATLEVTHINFTDNPFHKIKRKKWQNPHVVTLYLDHNTSLHTQRVLGQCFPTFTKDVLKGKQKDLLNTSFLKTVPQEARDLRFYALCAKHYIQEKNVKMALKCYLYLEKNYPYLEEIFKFKVAECYALLKDKTNMLHWLTTHIAETPFDFIKDWDISTAFKSYKRDKDVNALIRAYKKIKR